jgi:hypothetical protein
LLAEDAFAGELAAITAAGCAWATPAPTRHVAMAELANIDALLKDIFSMSCAPFHSLQKT